MKNHKSQIDTAPSDSMKVSDKLDSELRIRIRLPRSMGPVFEHIKSLPPSERNKHAVHLIHLGIMFERLCANGVATISGNVLPPEPNSSWPSEQRQTLTSAPVKVPQVESPSTNVVRTESDGALEIARARMGSPLALMSGA